MAKGDVGDVVRLVMKRELVFLAALGFLGLEKTGEVLFARKVPRVY